VGEQEVPNDESDAVPLLPDVADERRDGIAQAMWDDYQRILSERLADGDESDVNVYSSDEDED
jgi:hypothetical protein